ncbi:MAG: DUF1289 domain-containing protein [Proteobacteria bacterium]|nr:DUF1289 domain-containing protein [Pseudomonadota bacterium]
MSDITSPCIKNCCLDTNDVCIGCFRQLDEIMLWGKSDTSNEQKQQILVNINERKQLKTVN